MGLPASESQIVTACLDWLAAHQVFAWRTNNVGVWDPVKKVHRSFRGMKGVPDIIGIVPQRCPCTLQGVFLGVEVKRPGQDLRPEQADFLQAIGDRGGIGICVHGTDELERELAPFLAFG